MNICRWMIVLVLSFFISCCTRAGTYSLHLQYQPSKEFPSLQQKIGPSLGIAPIKDARPETLYIGIHTPLQGLPQGQLGDVASHQLEKSPIRGIQTDDGDLSHERRLDIQVGPHVSSPAVHLSIPLLFWVLGVDPIP